MARALSQEQDIQMMLAAQVHLGTKNCDFQMERYVFKRRTDGLYVINRGKTWDKLMMAARVFVAIENPRDIIVQISRPYGQRAILKFAHYTGANVTAVTRPVKEAALGIISTITFCDTYSPMWYVDIGIQANNKGQHSIGCLFWLLARMVLLMRGNILPVQKWDVMRARRAQKAEDDEIAAVEYPVADFSAAAGDWGAAPADLHWTEAEPVAAAILVVEAGWEAAAPPVAAGIDATSSVTATNRE